MGKSTGFIEYKRINSKSESPKDRILDFEEFQISLSQKERMEQASRCMDCGVPFCHSGIIISNMASGCPINNLIPEWNDLLYKGQFKEAYHRLIKTNTFPEFTGRVCPAPCEGSCTAGINGLPITIKNNELDIIEMAFANKWVLAEPPKIRTGKKVAVVGSGPAGLSCADTLNKMGHCVSVLEREEVLGGLLMLGIPNMKLNKKIVDRRIALMKEEGITFTTGVDVGNSLSCEEILSDYDAVVLCCGSTVPRDLDIEGRTLKGIHQAMDFLTCNTKNILNINKNCCENINASGKDVIVIGGGDTGTDCIATSIRQGAKSIVQFEILNRPNDHRDHDNPWPQWPKIFKTDYGHEECIHLYGKDPRQFSILTKKFVGDSNGHLSEVHTVNIEWQIDSDGRAKPIEIAGTQKIWPANLILIAMGFMGPEQYLISELGIAQKINSTVNTADGKYATNINGIFVAGDARRGQSLVVWAIKEGREAALECHEYLMR